MENSMKKHHLILVGAGYIDTKLASVLLIKSLANDNLTIEEADKKSIVSRLEKVKKAEYDKIFLVGTSVSGDGFIKVAQKLQKKIIWFSAYYNPKDELTEMIEMRFPSRESRNSCIYIVEDYIKENNKIISNKLFHRMEKVFHNREEPKERIEEEEIANLRDLLEAASSLVRRFRWQDRYEEILKYIATDKKRVDFTTSIINEYYKFGYRRLIGNSQRMIELKNQIEKIGKHEDCPVMIYGETGTGKETIAYYIHQKSSNRRGAGFVAFNCAVMTKELVGSELLGHKKGAFTGATQDKQGLIESADGGTLFLDEVTELSPELQAALLRILQEKRFARLGDTEDIKVDIRIIGATNNNIFNLMKEGKFRRDLYYRLAVVEVESPSLRDIKEDIELIAKTYARNTGYPKNFEFTVEQVEALKSYAWPGNVRELQNIIDRAKVFDKNDFPELIEEQRRRFLDLNTDGKDNGVFLGTERDSFLEKKDEIMHYYAKKIMKKYKTRKQAADAMGVSINTFRNHLEFQK